MATMGRRKITTKRAKQKQPDVQLAQIGAPTINLVVSTFRVQPIAILGFQPALLGAPIMREGFVTDTGFLQTTLDD